ncbi:hypothetical protein EXIGLDRAFT_449741 [Exidia glandulosa HHB12029]|uniref:Uncharacterized protein n=1 Tax=Exidia glandulosa HHB12029 TaxID=1314781 RepID=A0A165K8Q4_EXIGL|nr:hypothetical protein EXIGLDRAFT_449741 [Exidia glandulosa HHB12029]
MNQARYLRGPGISIWYILSELRTRQTKRVRRCHCRDREQKELLAHKALARAHKAPDAQRMDIKSTSRLIAKPRAQNMRVISAFVALAVVLVASASPTPFDSGILPNEGVESFKRELV